MHDIIQLVCLFESIAKVFHMKIMYDKYLPSVIKSRLTVVSCEAKEEVPCDGLSTITREYFTRTNLVKIQNAITDEPKMLGLYYSS